MFSKLPEIWGFNVCQTSKKISQNTNKSCRSIISSAKTSSRGVYWLGRAKTGASECKTQSGCILTRPGKNSSPTCILAIPSKTYCKMREYFH